MRPTVQNLLDLARVRHWSFAQAKFPPGVALKWLEQRQRTLLALLGDSIEGLVGTSLDIATTINGSLVGSSGGVPYYLDTYADGWAVHKTVPGVPYVNFDEAPIARDPYGTSGGAPGFPLPLDFVRLVAIVAVFSDGRSCGIDLVQERERHVSPRLREPAAFVSGRRIVPVRETATGQSDAWTAVTRVQISYVAIQLLPALTTELTLPGVLSEALVAGLTEMFAVSSQNCTPQEKRLFAEQRAAAEAEVERCSLEILGDVSSDAVIYHG